MEILPIKNICFGKNGKQSTVVKKAFEVINKQDGIDLFLDTYGALLNNIKAQETEVKQYKEALLKANTEQQKTIILKKIELLNQELKKLQNNKEQMERIIHIIDTLARNDNQIEIVYIDRRGEK